MSRAGSGFGGGPLREFRRGVHGAESESGGAECAYRQQKQTSGGHLPGPAIGLEGVGMRVGQGMFAHEQLTAFIERAFPR